MLKLLSLAALLLTLVPCLLFMSGAMNLDAVKWAVLFGTIVWFVTTPLWMGRTLEPDADQVQI